MTRRFGLRVGSFLGLLLPGLLVLLLLVPGGPAAAETKAYTMPAVAITATVQPDGSLQVTEERTFQYSGEFSWVEEWLPIPESSVLQEVSVAEVRDGAAVPYQNETSGSPGTFSVRREAQNVVMRWNFHALDERRVFRLSYRVPDAVRIHTDMAELYWQFVGDQWKVGTGQADVVLRLPEGAKPGEVLIWGHAPLTGGGTTAAPGEVHWQSTNLPPQTALEGRVVFPLRLVPDGNRKTFSPGLSAILDQEGAAAADRANAQPQAQSEAPVPPQPRPPLYPGWLEPLLIGFLLPPGVWLLARACRRYCIDPTPQPTVRHSAIVPGDYPPAVLGVLWRGPRRIGGPEFAATLLDLSRRRYLTLKQVGPLGEDLSIRRRSAGAPAVDDLAPHERLLVDFLFSEVGGGQAFVLLSDVKDYAGAGRTARAVSRFRADWRKAVEQAAESYGFWDQESREWSAVGVMIGIVGVVVGLILWIAVQMPTFGFLVILLGAGTFVAGVLAGRRTQFGADERARWEAFRRYLADYTEVEEATVAELDVWAEYLVYGTVLGAAEAARYQFKPAPESDDDPFLDAGGWLMQLDSLGRYLSHPFTSDNSSVGFPWFGGDSSSDSGGGFWSGGFSDGGGSDGGGSDGGGSDGGGGDSGGSDGGGGGDSG